MISSRSDTGGGPKHLLELSEGINKNYPHIRVSIAAPNDEPFGKKFTGNCSSRIFIPHRRFSFFKFWELLIFCRENDVDIIHSHGRGAGIYSRLVSLFGKKVIHTFHGIHDEKSFFGRLKTTVDRFLRSLATTYICVSNDEKDFAIAQGFCSIDQVNVVHNGVDVEKIKIDYDSITRDEARGKLGIKRDQLVYGTLARLNYQKGIDLLIGNTQIKKLENILFVVAGEGAERERLEEQLQAVGSGNIILVNQVDHPGVFLKAIDVYFSYSRWEGFPLSVLEALSVGKRCILSNVVGHGDFKELCYLFKLDDDLDFLRAIKEAPLQVEDFPFTLKKMVSLTVESYEKTVG